MTMDMDRVTSTARRLHQVASDDADPRLVIGAIFDLAVDAGMEIRIDPETGEQIIKTGWCRRNGGYSTWDLEQVKA